jgi:hypothetical protein
MNSTTLCTTTFNTYVGLTVEINSIFTRLKATFFKLLSQSYHKIIVTGFTNERTCCHLFSFIIVGATEKVFKFHNIK